jgi:predicted amino acid dehydrogenase
MGVRALREGAARQGIDLAESWLGVVGAPGNIASTYATVMASEMKGLVLIARSLSSRGLQPLVNQLKRAAPNTLVETSDSATALRKCRLVVTATVGAGDLVQAEHLAEGPVAICDISVPSDIAASVTRERPDALVIPGGIVRVRSQDDLSLVGLDLEPGHVLACLAETLLMGLEGATSHGSYGAITPDGVQKTLALADKHGFALADITAPVRTDR